MSRQIGKRLISVTLIAFFSCFLLAFIALTPAQAGTDGVEYAAHVANIGWQDYVAGDKTAGTEGRGLQLEAYKVRLTNPSNIGVEYRAHVQNIGWQDYVSDDQEAGTTGKGLHIEALSMRLTGSESPNYNIFYRVHIQDYGWLGWAKNGQDAGSTGMSKQAEALQILVLPATQAGPDQSQDPFVNAPAPQEPQPDKPDQSSPIHYRAYVAAVGWNPFVNNGTETGSGDVRGVEAITVGLSDELNSKGSLQFKTCGGHGWTPWLSNEDVGGAPGDPIQAVRIKLTKQLPYLYDIYYRVHVPNVGWSNWGRNGGAAGSEGLGRGISLIQIILNPKGDAPGPIDHAFTQAKWYWPLDGYHTITSGLGYRGGRDHDGLDIIAPAGTPIHSAKAGTVRIASYNGNFGNCVTVENDSGEFCYYAHMTRMAVNVGDRVGRGQVIGYVGSTGLSNKNHLHFEVYDDNASLIDPMRYY